GVSPCGCFSRRSRAGEMQPRRRNGVAYPRRQIPGCATQPPTSGILRALDNAPHRERRVARSSRHPRTRLNPRRGRRGPWGGQRRAKRNVMKILVTGSSGLVGTALTRALASAGHTVCRLVRPQSAAGEGAKEGFAVAWNPASGELGGAGVGADAVVNLAGASIAGGRWTAERKALLRSSRIDTTRALVNALARMNARPSVLISASGLGIYGNHGDET